MTNEPEDMTGRSFAGRSSAGRSSPGRSSPGRSWSHQGTELDHVSDGTSTSLPAEHV